MLKAPSRWPQQLKSVLAPFLFAVTALITNGAAQADIVTLDIEFEANTFQVGSGPDAPPVDPVLGSLTLTFDSDLVYTDETSGITLNSLNIALGSALSFSYDPAAGTFPAGTLRVGGLHAGSDVIIFNPSTNDFWLYINDIVGTPAFQQLGYTQTSVSSNNLFFTINQTGSVTVTSSVPEPSLGGLLLLAAPVIFSWRRRPK